jgi:hypothetical protein
VILALYRLLLPGMQGGCDLARPPGLPNQLRVRPTCAEHGRDAARKRADVPKHFLAVLVGGGLCPDHRWRGRDGTLGFAGAAALLLRHLRSPAASFNRAKGLAAVAAGLGFMVWFFGFMVIGGEWFQMWQSSQWNGQQAAFRFYLTILAVLIFVMQKDE